MQRIFNFGRCGNNRKLHAAGEIKFVGLRFIFKAKLETYLFVAGKFSSTHSRQRISLWGAGIGEQVILECLTKICNASSEAPFVM
jgi:hypothetical protein